MPSSHIFVNRWKSIPSRKAAAGRLSTCFGKELTQCVGLAFLRALTSLKLCFHWRSLRSQARQAYFLALKDEVDSLLIFLCFSREPDSRKHEANSKQGHQSAAEKGSGATTLLSPTERVTLELSQAP